MTTAQTDTTTTAQDSGAAIATRWTMRYFWVSTALLLVAGAMGSALRFSLADIGRMSDVYYYAVMTVHGLGAFVGWAAFAIMGASIWVLHKVGFSVRKLGNMMFATTFWTFIMGTVLIVITTMFMKFGGSWVFLYPLPFKSAGQWTDTAAGLFAFGVLLVGVGILAWCVGIIDTVVGPALHAKSKNLLNRLGVALGLGYLWPRSFATNPKPVPFAVIPLTVIAIDMIIATLPLAALLVQMIIQSFAPSVTVDPLLAKNILWWFGHPVVYLLLFPAVAVYYYLIPKYAGRKLVAGNIIAVAWTVAVIANIFVWAHHMYMDYPDHTHQGLVNTFMQPFTFALVLPSALSLYSLTFTVLRSRFVWTGASLALFLGMLSWCLAGLQGIINATIAANVVVHNTMWIVGHFHHMAILNIGLVIFAAIYHFVPQMTGKRLWSDALAKWHIWLTFWGQMINSAYWLIDGLRGSPRRFSVSLDKYDLGNKLALVGVVLLVIGQLIFVWNMWQTLRGKGGRIGADHEDNPRALIADTPSGRGANVHAGLAFGTFVAVLASSIAIALFHKSTEPATATGGTEAPAQPGADVFVSGGCGGCHTLGKANASGAVGPSFDGTQLTAAQAEPIIADGLNAMPAFAGQLTPEQITDVATYITTP